MDCSHQMSVPLPFMFFFMTITLTVALSFELPYGKIYFNSKIFCNMMMCNFKTRESIKLRCLKMKLLLSTRTQCVCSEHDLSLQPAKFHMPYKPILLSLLRGSFYVLANSIILFALLKICMNPFSREHKQHAAMKPWGTVFGVRPCLPVDEEIKFSSSERFTKILSQK